MRLSEAITIKLSPRGSEKTKAFIDEFWSKTDPHPTRHNRRAYRSVSLDIYPIHSGKIWLADIMVMTDGGEGEGTRALKFLMSLADKHGVEIEGEAKAYSNREGHITKLKDLLTWYRKNGFSVSGKKISYIPK